MEKFNDSNLRTIRLKYDENVQKFYLTSFGVFFCLFLQVYLDEKQVELEFLEI